MPKTLFFSHPNNCLFCNLCSLACSRKNEKVIGVEKSAIKIIKGEKETTAKIDKGRCNLCGECVIFCPTKCLNIEEYETETEQT